MAALAAYLKNQGEIDDGSIDRVQDWVNGIDTKVCEVYC